MIIDMHMHERTFSGDSRQNLREMVFEAKRKGLDGICITDHDAMGLGPYAAKVSQEENFPIFVGVEYLACEGDIVAFGLKELPAPHLLAQEFINYVTQQGGVCISAHPFRANSRGLAEELLRVQGLTGIEVLNGSTTNEENKKAMEYCQKLGLKAIGASDCHNLCAVGRFATNIDYDCKTVEDLVYALKNVSCEPVILSGYKPATF